MYNRGASLALGIMKKVEIYRDNDDPSLEAIVEQIGKNQDSIPTSTIFLQIRVIGLGP